VLNPRADTFLEKLRSLPRFEYDNELTALSSKHGNAATLVQAIIDERILSKDDACRYWADSMYVAYVDPFASVITEEAIEKIPIEVAKKVKAIGLYVLNGVLTVAMAAPADQELVKRLSQITQIPVSPVFALPR
jgi:type IV pilus assembly protein PilB